MSVVGVQRQYLRPPVRLQIQLTADSRVQWKRSESERKVWMCDAGGSTCFYGVWKSQHQWTSAPAFIWKSECSSASTAGWGSGDPCRNIPTKKKNKTHTHMPCAYSFFHIVCTDMHTHKDAYKTCTFTHILKWYIIHKPMHSSFIQPWWIFYEEIKGGLPYYSTSVM